MNQEALNICAHELEELHAHFQPPEGAQAAPDVFGLLKFIRDLTAAIKAGDYWAIFEAVYEIMGQFRRKPETDGGVAFALGDGTLRKKLLAIIAKILASLGE